MDKKKRSFFADSSSVFGNNILILIIGIATSILLARYLGPEGRGIYAAILVYPILLTSLAELGIRQSIIFLVGQKQYPPEKIIPVLLWMIIVSSMLSILIVGGIFFFLKDPDFSLFAIILALFYIPFRIVISYSQGVFVGKGEIWRFNQLNWIPQVILFLGIIILVVLGNFYVIGALVATLIGSLIMSVYALFLLSQISPLKVLFDLEIVKRLIGLGVLYGIALFIINLNYRIDIVIMQQLTTVAEIGLYTVGVSVAELVLQIPRAVGIVVFSRSANSQEPDLFSKRLTKLFRVSFISAMVCGIILALIAPYLVPFVFGTAFLPSVLVIQLIMPGIIMRTAFAVLNFDMAGKGKPVISLVALLPALIINVILNIILIPSYGANGAAFASSISYVFGSVFFICLYSKVTRINLRDIFRFQTSDFDFIPMIIQKIKVRIKGI